MAVGRGCSEFAWENGVVSDLLGIYVAVPFCRAKCSFCNFASDAFAASRIDGYLERLAREMEAAREFAVTCPDVADTVYFGGGTPSLLFAAQLERVFAAIRSQWVIAPNAEITMECAPGQIADASLDAMLALGVNRISMGVQSFIDAESAAVGRLHTRTQCLAEIVRLRARGVANAGIDLICGLPHQTRASWRETIQIATESGVQHISLYMLEVDEDSRLGRELIGGGARYRAGLVPHEDAVADMYLEACEMLAAAGVEQYEISNFARKGSQSRHNRKYWTRAPYLGFGLDAHSMLLNQHGQAVRFANGDDFESYMQAKDGERDVEVVDKGAAFEEEVFLGLRLVEGISLDRLQALYGAERMRALREQAKELAMAGLLEIDEDRMRLTSAGRVISSTVFGELLATGAAAR